jgi:hypothetical protein
MDDALRGPAHQMHVSSCIFAKGEDSVGADGPTVLVGCNAWMIIVCMIYGVGAEKKFPYLFEANRYKF